ncbi:MAG: TlpA family protein disulfide reductase [Methylomonas sp.]
MNKSIILTALFAVVALAAGVLTQQSMLTSAKIEDTMKPLEFSFKDVSDRMQSSSQWRGKILVVNFWATWCPPCLKEIPEFVKLQAQYQDKGLQFVGIAIEDKQPVADYLQRISINYPILIGGDGAIGLAQQMGNVIGAVPFTVVVNQGGQIVYRQPGELSVDKLQEVIAPLMAQK